MNLSARLTAEFGDAIAINEAQSIDGVLPQCAAAPRNEEAAQKLVAWCGAHDVAFIPIGGGTKIHIGAKPSRCDLLISSAHLNQVVEHDEGNATIQAGSGISLENLNQVVGEKNQFVPLDWSTPDATLGGVVAANHFGGAKLRFGAPRDLVVGLHAALSDGRLVKAGGKVVKNVSGYDLNKLFIGSFGSLGLITQVTIRLRPNDASQKYWGKMFVSLEEAQDAAQWIFDGAFEPNILRIVAHENQFLLWARFDGSHAAVSSQLEKLPESEMNAPQKFADENELELRAVLPLARASSWAKAALDAGASRVLWDFGLGIVRASWEKAPENIVGCVEKLRAQAIRCDGFVVVERAPHEMKTTPFVWGERKSDWVLMEKLKAAFDKANVCASGRFIGD